jgi:hypothetical protein
MENPWNGDTTYHVATEITKQVLWVKKLLAIISMQYYHPNSLSDQIRAEHNINTLHTFQYRHYLGRFDNNYIIISEMLKFFQKTYFQVFKKINCERKYWIFWDYFICQNEMLKNYLIIWQTCAEAAKPKVLYHATKYGDCKSDVVDFRLVLCKNGYCCRLATIMSPAFFGNLLALPVRLFPFLRSGAEEVRTLPYLHLVIYVWFSSILTVSSSRALG